MDFWDLLEILESNMKKSFESRFESEHSLVIDAVANQNEVQNGKKTPKSPFVIQSNGESKRLKR